MSQESMRAVSRSAFFFLSGTFLSRCSGLLRDVSMAFCFGSHPAVAAFMVAFRLANLFRRLFGEGSLPMSFIPHFEELRVLSPEKGASFFRDCFFSLAVFLCLLIALTGLVLVGLLSWIGYTEILFLTLLMLPGILFICLFGLCSALLQCEKKFFLSGFAPVGFNLVWVGAVFWFKNFSPAAAMRGLSVGIVLAFCVQWLFTAVALRHFLRWKATLFSREVRQVVKPLFLSIVGVGAVQINGALDSIFARMASLEGPAYLWYAIRIEQLPLALFGIALSSALLPPLTRALQSQQIEHYHELLRFAVKRSFNLMMPCSLGLLVLGVSGVNLLYGRGDFTQGATYETVICLWGYALGLIPSCFVLLLAPAFYAQKDYRTPMRASLYSVVLNVGLNALMVFVLHWGAFSIALATSFSAFFNCYLVVRALSVKIGWSSFLRPTLLTLIAAGATLICGYFWFQDPSWHMLIGDQNVVFVRQFSKQLLQGGVLASIFGLIWTVNFLPQTLSVVKNLVMRIMPSGLRIRR